MAIMYRLARDSINNRQHIPKYLDHTVYGEIVSENLNTELPRLPSAFNPFDMSDHLSLGDSGLDVLCIAKTTFELDAGLVRANAPIPPECDIYYFEVTVIDEGEYDFIGVGYCSGDAQLDQLPGWHDLSWGYHGDDGRAFDGRYGPVDDILLNNAYGPRFTLNDVIGCGIDLVNQTIFYTKNGRFLGVPFESVETTCSLYPCVGLNAPNTCVAANFGAMPFLFDIDRHVQRSRIERVKDIEKEFKDMGEWHSW